MNEEGIEVGDLFLGDLVETGEGLRTWGIVDLGAGDGGGTGKMSDIFKLTEPSIVKVRRYLMRIIEPPPTGRQVKGPGDGRAVTPESTFKKDSFDIL